MRRGTVGWRRAGRTTRAGATRPRCCRAPEFQAATPRRRTTPWQRTSVLTGPVSTFVAGCRRGGGPAARAALLAGWLTATALGVTLPASAIAAEPTAQQTSQPGNQAVKVRQQPFGKTPDGTEETLYILRNSSGSELRLTTFGARIVGVSVPDREGKLANVSPGFESTEAYQPVKAYFGCTTGRYATGLPRGGSPSTARNTAWRSTTAKTTFMAGSKALTAGTGPAK